MSVSPKSFTNSQIGVKLYINIHAREFQRYIMMCLRSVLLFSIFIWSRGKMSHF